MYQVVSNFLTYAEMFVPGQRQPLTLLQNLLDAGLFSNYVMYQNEREVRIAGNALAEVMVSTEAVAYKFKDEVRSQPIADPLKQVESALASLPIENWTAYGYVSFDLSRFYYPYSKAIQQPLLYFLVPETELCITAKGVRIRSFQPLTKVQAALVGESDSKDYVPTLPGLDENDRDRYQDRVDAAIQAIRGGDLHKAIISRAVQVKGNMDVLGTYTLGSKSNNCARSYCLQLEDIAAVGFSPEILLQVSPDGFVMTNPLAGTRPRGENLAEDTRLKHELFTDAKEVKEHALSIWLAQTEMASVCVPETVQVFDFMQVKQYRCVQHLSSRVGGQLRPEKTLWDALKVLFPGITVSGIDKARAIEWIDRLETEPRGIYAGGIGWVDSNGATDLAIAIRSAYQYGDRIYLNAGAGIVAESEPHKEYIESVNKMNTMLTNLVMK
ncbi:MAG: Salicylate synthase [Chroococcidiopsis sp. SAG 2025]|uniref:salicylate synthase n=1 Tax=Chroococcidiopsis sp. SAG 2025 TaxID=171389 RepID=UPI002936F7FB|nr:salicylate synthase [Chroococcidiopsis sp. SAG 2025]MDV2992193.1 Salicylate synthase [Chroococcidiopsis sp. SAG 2025]